MKPSGIESTTCRFAPALYVVGLFKDRMTLNLKARRKEPSVILPYRSVNVPGGKDD